MNNPYEYIGPHFDGKTYVAALDHTRLTNQLGRVYTALSDGRWHTLHGISLRAKAPESSCSARLRDLRKEKFGSHTVDTKRGLGGLFYYRLKVEPQREMSLLVGPHSVPLHRPNPPPFDNGQKN